MVRARIRVPSAWALRACFFVVSSLGGAGVAACSSSSNAGPAWNDAGARPNASATVEKDACSALSACCAADQAGELFCQETVDCDEVFQLELDYGECGAFTYMGYVFTPLAEPFAHP